MSTFQPLPRRAGSLWSDFEEWSAPYRAWWFHGSVCGRLVLPGQHVQRRWDGSCYDPGWEYRRVRMVR